jgi:hypothetical protein
MAKQNNAAFESLWNEHTYCDFTGKSLSTARRDRLLGKGCRYVKMGALVRYRPQDVREFIECNLRCGGELLGVK